MISLDDSRDMVFNLNAYKNNPDFYINPDNKPD